ncbi:ATP-binding protein [Yeguia hominis]|uniref:histidine kinase n=1 Tax=Yeguia hominis TaxID=2763662 RepID=A0A926HNQ7_9FIRM|nr:sensor histidine kinase [Yeguia hominis]MBC8534452.1 sensor histidine kinase [Yeguia hominis]
MQELSLNVLDIAQNAVRAEATEIQITVSENLIRDLLTIVIADNGCGMTPEQVRRVTDPFYTTRTTRKVGLGVPFFKMAAEMAGGTFSIVSQPGTGTTVTATFQRSHIDRMPLGDMPQTICCLMCMNEAINFVYTYQFNEKVFTVSSAELKAVLDGVPLSNPQVMQFINEFLQEHMDALENGASADEE